MSKLFISIALLLIIAANQAAACDMGAIETWVAAACQRDGCEGESIHLTVSSRCAHDTLPGKTQTPRNHRLPRMTCAASNHA